MTDKQKEHDFNVALRERTRDLRKRSGLEPQQVADLIGVDIEAYKKYETRSPLPRYLIPRFARAVRVSIAYLMTGYEEN